MPSPPPEPPAPGPAATAPPVTGSPAPGGPARGGRARGGSPSRGPARGRSVDEALPASFWRWGFPLLVVVLGVCIPLLGTIGARIVLDSTDGNLTRREEDPRAPGYEAIVEPTPTMFVLQLHDGAPVGAAAIALSGEDSGGVIVMSVDTVVDREGTRLTIGDAYASGGLDAARAAAELAVGVQLVDAVEVDDQRLADLVEPVGALTLDNNDPVEVDGEVLFPAGEVEVAPSDLGAFLGTTTEGTGEVNRLLRYEAFWDAWLAQVAAGGEGSIPGEGDSGVGFVMSRLAAGEWTVAQLPAQPLPIPGTTDVLFQPDAAAVSGLIAELVPFPVGAPPGSRLRVRLLDGTGQLDRGIPAAEAVVAGGGEVAVVGNAETFDVATTEILIGDPAQRPQAEELRASLGVGEIIEGGAGGGSDVTVVLGRDALEQFSENPGTVTVAPSGSSNSAGDGDGGG